MKIVAPAAVVAFVLILANYCDNGTSSRAASPSSRQVAVTQEQAKKDQAARKKAAAEKKAAAARKKAAAEKKAAAARKAELERRQAEEKRQAEEAARKKAAENAAAEQPKEPEPERGERAVVRPIAPGPQEQAQAARRLPAGQCPGSVAFGQVGGDVLMLQAALVARGFPTENDGRFGSETRQSVKNIQARRSLPQTGKVDDRVWQALGRC